MHIQSNAIPTTARKKTSVLQEHTFTSQLTQSPLVIRRSSCTALAFTMRTKREFKTAGAPFCSNSSIEALLKKLQIQCVQIFACFDSTKATKQSGVSENKKIYLETALHNKEVQHYNKKIVCKFKYLNLGPPSSVAKALRSK